MEQLVVLKPESSLGHSTVRSRQHIAHMGYICIQRLIYASAAVCSGQDRPIHLQIPISEYISKATLGWSLVAAIKHTEDLRMV